MKKLFVFLTVLTMIGLYCPALAETADAAETEYTTYANITFGYHVDYPSGWILMDQETLDDYIRQMADGEQAIEGMSASALDTMQLAMASAPEDGLVEFFDSLGNTITVSCSSFATPDSLELANSGISPMMIAYYETLFIDTEVLDGGSITAYGDKEYLQLVFQATIDNTVCTQTLLYYFQNDIAYAFCFTWVSTNAESLQELEKILETVMNSFALET